MGQSTNQWILGCIYLASPVHFVGVDDIFTNLAKEREPQDHGMHKFPNL